jgi:hypothetical protein
MKLLRMSAVALTLVGACLIAIPQAAMAQQHYAPSYGAGVTTLQPGGGQNVTFDKNGPVARPVSGLTASEFSTTVEFESWKNDPTGGIMRGDRQTIIAGYTKSHGNDEISALLPYQFLEVKGLTRVNRFDDSEVTWRRYKYDASDPSSLTTVYGVKAIVPTGAPFTGVGIGRWGIGPTATISKPVSKALLYVGGSYTFLDKVSGDNTKDPLFAWVGAVAQLSPTASAQLELTKFRSPNNNGQDNLRLLVGPRFAISPTASFQVNLKQELQQKSKDTTISIGYSNRI